jgi:hypothetical protein
MNISVQTKALTVLLNIDIWQTVSLENLYCMCVKNAFILFYFPRVNWRCVGRQVETLQDSSVPRRP